MGGGVLLLGRALSLGEISSCFRALSIKTRQAYIKFLLSVATATNSTMFSTILKN